MQLTKTAIAVRSFKLRTTKTQKLLRIMKLTAILLTAFCLNVAATGTAQGITLKLKNASLEKVFTEIKKQTGYSFVYNNNLVATAKKVDLQVSSASIEEVLDKCFKDQPLTYTIVEKTIIVKPREDKSPNDDGQSLTTDHSPLTIPPPIDITGKVTDENGNPLVGASVKVKNSSKGTTTNNDGVFVLKSVDDDAVLEISYVGFETISISVSNRTSIVTSLKQKPENLGEVVIQKGYYTEQQKYTLGNSVHIGKEAFENSPVQNPLLAIQGRATGIEITQLTGVPGGGVTVRIQGRNSINSGLDPLIVIDGVPFGSQLAGNGFAPTIVQFGSPLNYINPSDIESIDILKDADATAIYGSRAANGAILITTKKGKAGKTKLSLNLEQGWGKVGHFVDMMNTRQYLDMRYEAYRNDGIALSSQAPSFNNYDLKLWDTTRYTDWQKTLIGGTAKYTNINASISGGTSSVQYLVGATYNRQTTVFPGDFDNQLGALNFSLTGTSSNQKLKMDMSSNYSYSQNRLPDIDLTNQAIQMEPDAPGLHSSDGTLNWAPDAAGNSSWTNPLAYTTSTEYNNTAKNLVANLRISYKLFRGLEIKTNVGYTNTISESYEPTRLETFKPEDRIYSTRSASFENSNSSSWIIEPSMQYSGDIGKGEIDAFLGTTILKNSSDYQVVSGSGFPTDLLMKTLKAATSTTIVGSASSINRYNALFGRLGYSWYEKYLLSLTARRDGSSKFGDKNKFHNFWSVAGGWIFSQENWVHKALPFLSFGKLRASYGITGNDQINDFAYLSIYSISNPTIPFQNSIGLNATNTPNPYLQWEETRKWAPGIDLGFISDRIVIGVTRTYNRSSNQLISFVLPSLTGFTSITKNLPATIQNTSWEFSLNTMNVKAGNFSWRSSVNLTIPRNKVTEFPGIELTVYANPIYGVVVGEPLGVKKVYKYSGINAATGRPLVMDKNGNPTTSILTASQNQNISLLTKYYGGIINNIGFKGFQLDFLIQFVRKAGSRDLYWYNGSQYPGMFSIYDGSSNQPISVLDRWRKPGDNTTIPRYSTSLASSTILSSDAFYNFDASYIRVKNVSLSWQLPGQWIKRMNLQNVRLYANAQNLFTITKYSGLDPESGSFGMPPLRMITTGVNIDF